jgi:putative membrane protein
MPASELCLMLLLGSSGLAYAIGLARVWRAAGPGHGVGRLEAGAFAAGWLTLVVALLSPLDRLSEQLFAAHMVQHELLMVVAAPLVVLSAPLVVFAWLLPARSRRWVFDGLRSRPFAAISTTATAPAIVWLLHAIALWLWHLPTLFDATLENDLIHAAQHLSFFGTAVLFWWGISHGRYGRLSYGAAVLYTFATAGHSGILGALLTFSPHPWYSAYATTTTAWGLTPLEDQQLGGLVMWVPAGMLYTLVGLAYFAAWIREAERRSRFRAPRIRRDASIVCLLVAASVQSIACGTAEVYRTAAAMTGGDPERGRQAIVRYGCDTCHTIPGVKTARALVGPPLTQVAARVYLAGHLPNTPENMQTWIRHPHAMEPHTAMPDTGVTDLDARDIAAYLYTLR